MGYFDKIKEVAGKAVNAANSAVGGLGEVTIGARKMLEGQGNNTGEDNKQKNHEFPFLGFTFYPSVGIKTTFFEDYMEHGGDSVPYGDMLAIEMTHIANNNFTDATAQATLKSGKTMTLGVRAADMQLFLQAIGYANDKISESLGEEKAYKYGIRSNDGNAVEVYEDCLVFKTLSKAMFSQTNKNALPFSDIEDITVAPEEENLSIGFKIKGIEQTVRLLVPNYMGERATETVDYINQRREELSKKAEETANETPVAWQPYVGEEKCFPLNGATLVVSPQMDLFNSYRLKYREVANEYASLARNQYNKKVHDFDSFMMFFPTIYVQYLDKLLQGGVDILVADGVWSETVDSMREKHTQSYHMAVDDYEIMEKNLGLTEQANQNAVDAFSGAVPTLQGGGFGFKGAMKGIAKAEAFNFAKSAIAGALKSANKVNQAQKAELFGRVNPDNLFNRVFCDYWNVFMTLVSCMAQNGKEIWISDPSAIQQAQNIMKNLTNPNFPQDKTTEVVIQILTTCPYNIEFQKMLITKFEDTEEVKNINGYFGYTSFDDIHITG